MIEDDTYYLTKVVTFIAIVQLLILLFLVIK